MPNFLKNQTFRTFVYSSIAIVVLTLVWGFRQIPQQSELAKATVKASLEQELLNLNSAVKSGVQAMQYRLLDVLKAEGGDSAATRAFQDSPFFAASLLEWDGSAWKPQWLSNKIKDAIPQAKLIEMMKSWPLSQMPSDEAHFVKVGEFQGQAHFAILVPVRRVNQTPLIGVGIFPASQFGLGFSADSQREVRVFDDKGYALALSRPSYLGAALKNETLVGEILDSGEVSVRQDWKSERGDEFYGVASKLPGSNLYTSVETRLDFGTDWILKSWLYLLFVAAAALALNWFLFNSLFKPLLEQMSDYDLRLRGPAPVAARRSDNPIPAPKLPEMDFLEAANYLENAPLVPTYSAKDADSDSDTVAAGSAAVIDAASADSLKLQTATTSATESVSASLPNEISLNYVVTAALRSLSDKIKEQKITVNKSGLEQIQIEADPLQLQTALEEILKNSIEAIAETSGDHPRVLTIAGSKDADGSRLTIEDTGTGIANENLAKVFDPFYSTKDNEGVSRGLGLNVARRVIEELKGLIKLSSRQGGIASGTKVQIDWPLAAEVPVRKSKAGGPAERSQAVSNAVAAALNAVKDMDDFGFGRGLPEAKIRKPVVKPLARTLD